jgi:ubiquinone/menaquinone biosynthesis C-methylase UbiE
MIDQAKTLDDVRDYWNEYVIGIDITDETPGSPEFFDEMEAYYHLNHVDPKLIDYSRSKGKKLLEVGCGWGCDLILFAKNGANVTGLDLSASAIELAKKYFALRHISADLRVGNAECLPFPDEEFDVVVSLGVLHHTPDTERALNEVYRVLKPGGEALILLYNRYSWYNLLCKISGTHYEHFEKDAPIVKLYSRNEVLRLMSRYSRVEIEVAKLPQATVKRRGLLAVLYNNLFVPICKLVPTPLIRPFGFHIVARATKLCACLGLDFGLLTPSADVLAALL